MILHSVLFPNRIPGRHADDYERMAKVFALSCAENSPTTPLTIHRIAELDQSTLRIGDKGTRKWAYTRNALKTKHHSEIVQQAQDGELIGLLDCDMMILGDLSEVEQYEFDLCITERSYGFKWNTGVVFVRVSERMREWFRDWHATALAMLENAALHKDYQSQYGGINQSALAALMKVQGWELKVKYLSCRIWNAVQDDWKYVDENTKAVHILTTLQNACLHKQATIDKLKPLVKRWQDYERRAMEVAA